jgi:TonB family protein
LNWWNPLAWATWRAFLRERERAADDLVLSSGATATSYAEHLLEIARTMQPQPGTAAAALAMARRSQLEGRLMAILDSGIQRTQPRRATALAAIALAIACMIPMAAVRAQAQADSTTLQDVDTLIATANAQKNREILDQAALSYEKLRKFAEARKLREASLGLAEQIYGAQSPEYATALIRLGDLVRRFGGVDLAESFYTKALALGDRPDAFPALLRLGMSSKNPDTRREYLQRAQAVARNGNETATAMTWLAHEHENDADGAASAESLYRSATAIAEPDSGELALALEMYARFLTLNGNTAEAEPVLDRAKTIRRMLVLRLTPTVATDATPYKVGGDVKAPSLVSKVEPEYSEEARKLKVSGPVLLKVTIDTDGLAKNMQVTSGQGYGLDEKAVQAIALWKFKPGERGGVAVPVLAQIEVNFRLM